ncbi:MAG: metal-dependent transcriptional regulator [Corynebacterium sp.]|nr:metal-dependent transcriptional regulator [Corynebacterium sp.]
MKPTHVTELPLKTQDYLKHIWDIYEHTGHEAQLKDIAARMGEKASTASEAIKRLSALGLVEHKKYAGIVLTELGRSYAVAVVRRHRLLETFLVEVLGYTWDEVHDDAELLEHSVSDRLLERIDAHLNYPLRDPHGDPIPTAEGEVTEVSTRFLDSCAIGEKIWIDRILDHEPDVLRYLAELQIVPGTGLVLVESPMPGMLNVRKIDEENTFSLTTQAAALIAVKSQ